MFVLQGPVAPSCCDSLFLYSPGPFCSASKTNRRLCGGVDFGVKLLPVVGVWAGCFQGLGLLLRMK